MNIGAWILLVMVLNGGMHEVRTYSTEKYCKQAGETMERNHSWFHPWTCVPAEEWQ